MNACEQRYSRNSGRMFFKCTRSLDVSESTCSFYEPDDTHNDGSCKWNTSPSGEYGDWCHSYAAQKAAISAVRKEQK